MSTPARSSPMPRRRRSASTRSGWLSRALEHPEAPYLLLCAGFCLVALYLRFDRLGAQSLWFDEADAVIMARQSLGALIKNIAAAGQNGPLYILFLHLWMLIFGTSEAAVRLPSALAGTLAVPLMYLLGRKLHGPKLGLYAAGMLAISPYQHWYAQEAKMYAILVTAAIGSTLALLFAVADDRPRSWVIYVGITTVALYIHVMAALLIAAQGLWVLLMHRGRAGSAAAGSWRHRVPRAGWAFAALTLPYLPIALWELQFVSSGAVTWHRPIGILALLRDLFTKIATGVRVEPWLGWQGLLIFGALAALGAVPLVWRESAWLPPGLTARQRSGLLLALVWVPIGLFYLSQLIRPLYADRYLIVITPAFLLLVAGGVLAVERYWRPLAVLALVGILATSWVPLRDLNLAETAQKEDWRTAYQQIADHWHPNDALVIHPGYLDTTFAYYALRDSRLRAMTVLTLPNEFFDGTTDEATLDRYWQQTTVGYERVWLLLSPDRLALVDPFDRRGDCERDRLRNWYCYNGHQLVNRELNGLWLGLYAYNRPFGTAFYPPPAIRLDLPVGQQLTLVGYSYDFIPSISTLPPGATVPLVLQWSYRERDNAHFALRWSLRDPQGQMVPAVGATEPLLGDNPPQPREKSLYFWDYHDLVLPQTIPAGRYQLLIEIVAAEQPATVLAPGTIPLGWFTVR